MDFYSRRAYPGPLKPILDNNWAISVKKYYFWEAEIKFGFLEH